MFKWLKINNFFRELQNTRQKGKLLIYDIKFLMKNETEILSEGKFFQ